VLPFSEHHFDAVTDHAALIADLTDLGAAVSAGLTSAVPIAALEALGVNLLNAAPGDFGALPIRWDPQATFALGNLDGFTAFHGGVRVPLLLGAAMAGRTDLRPRFVRAGRFSPEHALQWLVCHGLNEHRLWHGLSARFVGDLLRPSVELAIGKVPPLGLLLMQERADLRGRFILRRQWSQAAFDTWLSDYGIKDYGLFWCLGKSQARQWAGRDWPAATETHGPGNVATVLDATAAYYLEPAADWVRQRTAAWHAAGRLFPAFELEAAGLAMRLVGDGRIVPSYRWLACTGSRIALLTPRQRVRESFVAVEFRVEDGAATPGSACLSLNGKPLPTGLLAGNGTQVAVGWAGGVGGADRSPGEFGLLSLDLPIALGEGAANGSFELLRVWNL
jgi:hypothetical protein